MYIEPKVACERVMISQDQHKQNISHNFYHLLKKSESFRLSQSIPAVKIINKKRLKKY